MRGSLSFLCSSLASFLLVSLLSTAPEPALAYPVASFEDIVQDWNVARDLSHHLEKRQSTKCKQVADANGVLEVGTQKLRKLGGVPFVALANCPNRGFDFNPRLGVVTANTNLQRDTKVAARVPRGRPKCDHSVELNMLLDVIEQSGGLCQELNRINLSAAQQDAILEPLRVIINSQANLNLVTPGIEDQKNDMIPDFRAFLPGRLIPRRHVEALAAVDYINKLDTAATRVADDLDAEINNIVAAQGLNLAPGLFTVRQYWKDFVAFAGQCETPTLAEARRLLAQAQQAAQQQAQQTAANNAACGRPGAAGGGRTGNGTTRKLRMIKRRDLSNFMSIFARQGPGQARRNTAPAPSCPAPGTPPKRAVPANQLVERQPAGNPRLISSEAARPAPRPTPNRTARPRPANRPRRVPGQPAPRPRAAGRTTPARKPKAVPRPAGRAAGRPRGRRGRR